MFLLYVTSLKGLLILNKLYTAYITMWSVIRRHLQAASDLSIINLPLSLKSMLVVYDCLSFISGTRQTDSGLFQRHPPLPPHPLIPPRGKNPTTHNAFTLTCCQSSPFSISRFFSNQVPSSWPWSQKKIHGDGSRAPTPPAPTFVVSKITPVHCASKCGQSILAPWHRFWDYYIMGEHRRVRHAPSAGQQTEGVAHNIRFHCKLQRKTAQYFSIFWPLLRFKILPNYGDRQHFQTTIPAASQSINKLKCLKIVDVFAWAAANPGLIMRVSLRFTELYV